MQFSQEQILIYNDGLHRPNPNAAGPIVHRPMGLLNTAGCDTAWNRTRVCSDTSSTEMQCIRPLRDLVYQNYEITHMESCSKQKSVKQIKKYFISEILQSSHPLPWWQLCTLLAISQSTSSGMLFQQSWRSSHICWALVGSFSFTLRSNSSQTISIGLRLGDCGGQVIWHSLNQLCEVGTRNAFQLTGVPY